MKKDTKTILSIFRNTLAFSYAWLVLCSALAFTAGGSGEISTSYLFKLLLLCAWGSLCFSFCFFSNTLKKKGFIFCLTLFYISFIPVEILIFYAMKLFTSGGSPLMWIIFAGIVAALYITCILIDRLVMAKRAAVYTEKLNSYLSRN